MPIRSFTAAAALLAATGAHAQLVPSELDRTFSGDGSVTVAYDEGAGLRDEAIAVLPMPTGYAVVSQYQRFTDRFGAAVAFVSDAGVVSSSVKVPLIWRGVSA